MFSLQALSILLVFLNEAVVFSLSVSCGNIGAAKGERDSDESRQEEEPA